MTVRMSPVVAASLAETRARNLPDRLETDPFRALDELFYRRTLSRGFGWRRQIDILWHGASQSFGMSIAATRAQAAPSTGITAPLTKLASSEARKSAAAAISSGRPKRPGRSVAS